MAHVPGTGRRSSIRRRSRERAERAVARFGRLADRRGLFPALCANGPAGAGPGQRPLVYSPAPALARPALIESVPERSPEGVAWSCPRNSSSTPAWREIRAELRRASASPPTRSGSRRSRSRTGTATVLLLDGAARRPGAGSPSASAASSSAVRRRSSAPRSRSRSRASPRRGAERGPRRRAEPPSRDPSRAFNPRYSFDQFIIGDGNRLAHAAALAVAELPGPGLQPAVPPRAARARQDPPAARDRQLRPRLRRRRDRPLHDRRGVHQPLHHRARHAVARPLQARLPRRRRAADRRRPVPRQQGQDRGGVLPHLQRPVRDRAPARAHLRPPPAPAASASRSGCASASSPGSSPTSSRPTSPPASRSCASAPRSTAIALADAAVLELIAERVTDNIRALEGALIRVVAYHSLTGRPIDVELAGDVLDEIYPADAPPALRRSSEIQARRRRLLRHLRRRARLRQPRRARRLAAPGRDLPRPRAHRRLAARRSARPSAAATTRPSCTPASASPSALVNDHEAARRRRRAQRTLIREHASRPQLLTDLPVLSRDNFPARCGRTRTSPQLLFAL